MRDTIPRKQQTSHSAWDTLALRPRGRDGIFRGLMERGIWGCASEAVSRLHRELTRKETT